MQIFVDIKLLKANRNIIYVIILPQDSNEKLEMLFFSADTCLFQIKKKYQKGWFQFIFFNLPIYYPQFLIYQLQFLVDFSVQNYFSMMTVGGVVETGSCLVY